MTRPAYPAYPAEARFWRGLLIGLPIGAALWLPIALIAWRFA